MAGALIGAAAIAGILLAGDESIALPGDQVAAWTTLNDEILPALAREREAIAAAERLAADVTSAEVALADLKAQARAAKDAAKVAKAAAKAARSKLAMLASAIDRMPPSLKASGQLEAVERLKDEPPEEVTP
jgi:hypothetical protein